MSKETFSPLCCMSFAGLDKWAKTIDEFSVKNIQAACVCENIAMETKG